MEPPAPPAPPTPPPAPPAPKIVQVTEAQTQYIVRPQLVYPSVSKRMNEVGSVVIAVDYDARGIPKRAEVFKSSGFERLDRAAREAAMTSRVTPFRQAGASEETVYRLMAPFNFVLN